MKSNNRNLLSVTLLAILLSACNNGTTTGSTNTQLTQQTLNQTINQVDISIVPDDVSDDPIYLSTINRGIDHRDHPLSKLPSELIPHRTYIFTYRMNGSPLNPSFSKDSAVMQRINIKDFSRPLAKALIRNAISDESGNVTELAIIGSHYNAATNSGSIIFKYTPFFANEKGKHVTLIPNGNYPYKMVEINLPHVGEIYNYKYETKLLPSSYTLVTTYNKSPDGWDFLFTDKDAGRFNFVAYLYSKKGKPSPRFNGDLHTTIVTTADHLHEEGRYGIMSPYGLIGVKLNAPLIGANELYYRFMNDSNIPIKIGYGFVTDVDTDYATAYIVNCYGYVLSEHEEIFLTPFGEYNGDNRDVFCHNFHGNEEAKEVTDFYHAQYTTNGYNKTDHAIRAWVN